MRRKHVTEIYTSIVVRAFKENVTDLGQLTRQQRRELDYAVKHRILAKGKGGPFPILKTVYARPEFDIAADRMANVEHMKMLARLDEERLGHPTIFSQAHYR